MLLYRRLLKVWVPVFCVLLSQVSFAVVIDADDFSLGEDVSSSFSGVKLSFVKGTGRGSPEEYSPLYVKSGNLGCSDSNFWPCINNEKILGDMTHQILHISDEQYIKDAGLFQGIRLDVKGGIDKITLNGMSPFPDPFSVWTILQNGTVEPWKNHALQNTYVGKGPEGGYIEQKAVYMSDNKVDSVIVGGSDSMLAVKKIAFNVPAPTPNLLLAAGLIGLCLRSIRKGEA
ncbi:hypothetical protein QQM79_11485 [Marinobacteraceae bacterium S3BR75-40.1]